MQIELLFIFIHPLSLHPTRLAVGMFYSGGKPPKRRWRWL
jgi:hypothetical protein